MPAFMMAAMESRLIMSSASNHPWLTSGAEIADAMHVFISNTACFSPTKTARLTMLWPMLSSSILGKPRHRPNVLIIEAVAGVQFHSGGDGRGGGRLEQLELAVAIAARTGVGVAPGVKLDRRRAQLDGGLDLRRDRDR